MPPKKKKKEKMPSLELPIEEVEMIKLNFDKLVQHGIKVAAELDKIKKERVALEEQRDKMSYYWDNAVFQLMKIERDIRHMERENLNKKFEGEREFCRLNKDLRNIYQRNTKEWGEHRSSRLTNIYEEYDYNFIKDEQLLKDVHYLRKQYFETVHQQDQARAGARIENHAKAMDNFHLHHLRELKALEIKTEAIHGKKYKDLTDRLSGELLTITKCKDKEVRTIEHNHKVANRDILEVYENITKHNFTLINTLGNELNDLKKQEMTILRKYNEVKAKHDRMLHTIKYGTYEVIMLKREMKRIEEVHQTSLELKRNQKEYEKQLLDSSLKVSLLEDAISKEKDMLKVLKTNSIHCLLNLKEKQTRMQVWLEMIRKQLEKGANDRKELIERCMGRGLPEVSGLINLKNDFRDIRLTTIDILKRCMELQNLKIETLSFRLNIDFKEPSQKAKVDTKQITPKLPRVGPGIPLFVNFYNLTEKIE